MKEEGAYKVIKLQNLPKKEILTSSHISHLESARRLSKDQQIGSEKDIYCYMDTGLEERLTTKHNQFFMAFLNPYNIHGDILLVPDDIWLAILMFLSKYVDSNA